MGSKPGSKLWGLLPGLLPVRQPTSLYAVENPAPAQAVQCGFSGGIDPFPIRPSCPSDRPGQLTSAGTEPADVRVQSRPGKTSNPLENKMKTKQDPKSKPLAERLQSRLTGNTQEADYAEIERKLAEQ